MFTGIVFHLPTVNVPDFPAAANGWINGLNFVNFLKNITLAGAYIMLATNGAGAYSVDARRGASAARRLSEQPPRHKKPAVSGRRVFRLVLC